MTAGYLFNTGYLDRDQLFGNEESAGLIPTLLSSANTSSPTSEYYSSGLELHRYS